MFSKFFTLLTSDNYSTIFSILAPRYNYTLTSRHVAANLSFISSLLNDTIDDAFGFHQYHQKSLIFLRSISSHLLWTQSPLHRMLPQLNATGNTLVFRPSDLHFKLFKFIIVCILIIIIFFPTFFHSLYLRLCTQIKYYHPFLS